MLSYFHFATLTVATNAAGVDLQTILVYYAIGCLIMLPIYAIIIVYLCKKQPEKIRRFNSWLDRILGIENSSPKEKKDEPEKKETEKNDKESESLSIEEENEQMGVSTMNLKVGDTYKCYVSDSDRKFISGLRFIWNSTDRFVGTIDKNTGRFEATKVGQTYIECSDKQIYFVNVKPSVEGWFAEPIMKLVLDNMDIVNITANFIKRKIIEYDEQKKVISYDGWEPGIISLSFEYNKRKETVRALVKMANGQERVKEIISNLSEYMSQVKVNDETSTTRYWVHMDGAGDGESVDYTAFLKTGTDGVLYFGVGECWRIGAGEIEIQANPEMIDRSFKTLLPASEMPAAVKTNFAQEEKPKKKKDAEPAKAEPEPKPAAKSKKPDAKKKIKEKPAEKQEKEDAVVDYNPGGDAENFEESFMDESGEDNGAPADPFADFFENNGNEGAGFDTSEN